MNNSNGTTGQICSAVVSAGQTKTQSLTDRLDDIQDQIAYLHKDLVSLDSKVDTSLADISTTLNDITKTLQAILSNLHT